VADRAHELEFTVLDRAADALLPERHHPRQPEFAVAQIALGRRPDLRRGELAGKLPGDCLHGLRFGTVDEADALVARGEAGAHVGKQDIGALARPVERTHVSAGTDMDTRWTQLDVPGRQRGAADLLGPGTTDQE